MNEIIEDAVECPSCGEMAVPEQDGDVLYWACGCGLDFGYRVVNEDPSCQLGIPEETRRAASAPDRPGPVAVQIGRRPDVPA